MNELGSLAELVSAFAAVGALIAATLAARAAIQSSRQQGLQLDKLEEAEQERRREVVQRDASGVAFWMAVDGDGRPGVRFRNNGPLPIYDFTVWMASPHALLSVRYHSYGPTGDEHLLGRTQRAMMNHVRSDSGDQFDWRELFSMGRLTCASSFRDASNRWWLRGFDGRLVRLAGPEEGRSLVESEYEERRWPA